MNKISKQQIGSNQTLAPGPSIQNPPDMMDAISDPGLGPAPVIKNGSQHLNPSVRSGSPPPQYTEVGKISSLKHKSPSSQNLRPIQSVLSQDPQGPLSRFSTRVDLIPPAQPGAQTFFAEHIHMYHGCPPTQYPGNMFPGAPPTATWQPIWQPPPPPPGPPLFVPPPLAYKSSAYSLRETLATEFLDLIKPDASCVHGVRHYKKHSSCPWGCCWQRGCFNGC